MTKEIKDFLRHGAATPLGLAILGLIGLFTIGGLVANPFSSIPQVDMRTDPQSGVITTNDSLVMNIIVESSIPVNAFEGNIEFDSSIFKVERIDYNTSIADLWVKEPWYSNGDGTIYFAGGTTRKGGFTGIDTLMTITFKTLQEGDGLIAIRTARIMQHDGFGTDALLKEPIDSVFTVTPVPNTTKEVLRKKSTQKATYIILDKKPSTDLNEDGKQTLSDLSIFMLDFTRQNKRSDFNNDNIVNTADLSIIMNAQ